MATEGTPKRSRLKGKGGLIGIAFLAILGAVLYLDMQRPPREPGQEPFLAELLGMRAANVTGLEVRQGEETLYALEKRGDDWYLTQPIQARADRDRVEQLLEDFIERSVDRELPPEARDLGPAEYGFHEPELEIVLRAGRRERTVRVGETDARGFAYFLEISDHPRYVAVPEYRVRSFRDETTDSLRDPNVLAVDRDSVQRIEIRAADGAVTTLEKRRDDWEITAPFQAPASGSAAASLIGQLDPLRAREFVADAAEDLAPYGLDEPAVTVSVRDRRGTYTVLLGKQAPEEEPDPLDEEEWREEPGYYAKRADDPTVFVIEKWSYDALRRTASELRSLELLSFAPDDPETITIRNEHGELELVKRAGEWWLVRPTETQADGERVIGLIGTLRQSASRHVEERPADLARYGLDSPQAQVNVTLPRGRTQRLLLGSPVPERPLSYYAKSSLSEAVFEVQQSTWTDVNVKAEELKPGG